MGGMGMFRWIPVGAWSVVIFLSVPFARTIQSTVEALFGREFFLVLVLSLVAVAIISAICWRICSCGRRSIGSSIWILLTGAVCAFWTFRLRSNPEEAFHFIEYGILGIFAFRALSFRTRDPLVYLSAALVCSLVGTMDEILQWIAPLRTFDYRDIFLNAAAGMMMQIALALGIRPAVISQEISVRSVRQAAVLAGVQILLLAICMSNTPDMVRKYTDLFPSLSYLTTKDNAMTEYGFRHRDQDDRVWYSRFGLSELSLLDPARAEEAGRVLREFRDPSKYGEFLGRYTPVTDPFLHEMRVRIFRRDEYARRAFDANKGEKNEECSVAVHEEMLLRKYFPKSLAASGLAMNSAAFQYLRTCMSDDVYESAVSADLITRYSLLDVWVAAVLALLGLYVIVRVPVRSIWK